MNLKEVEQHSLDLYQLPLVTEPWFLWSESRKMLLEEKWEIWFVNLPSKHLESLQIWILSFTYTRIDNESLLVTAESDQRKEKTLFMPLVGLFSPWCQTRLGNVFGMCLVLRHVPNMCLTHGIQTWAPLRDVSSYSGPYTFITIIVCPRSLNSNSMLRPETT